MLITETPSETPEAPPAEPVVQTTEQNEAPVEKKAVAESDPAPPEEEKPQPQPHELPRGVQRRIDRAIAQRAQAQERERAATEKVSALEAKLAEYQIAPDPQAEPKQDPHKIAARMVEEQNFTQKSNAAFDQGQKAFKDFDTKLEQLASLGMDDSESRRFMEAVLDCEKPAEVLYYLGSRPDEAADLLSLSERQQVRALAKLEVQLASAPKVSHAPPPIKPIGTRGSAANSDPETMSQKEYEAWRAKQGARWAR